METYGTSLITASSVTLFTVLLSIRLFCLGILGKLISRTTYPLPSKDVGLHHWKTWNVRPFRTLLLWALILISVTLKIVNTFESIPWVHEEITCLEVFTCLTDTIASTNCICSNHIDVTDKAYSPVIYDL